MRSHVRVVTFAAAVLVVAACSGPTFVVPADSTPPEEVLATYLRALVRGDCSAGRLLGTPTFRFGNGELCGSTSVSSFTILGPPAGPNENERVFATTLVTTGSADGSIQRGDMTWFYDLQRQPTGAWRITGGGSGP